MNIREGLGGLEGLQEVPGCSGQGAGQGEGEPWGQSSWGSWHKCDLRQAS